jgi:hypothetical protein
MDVDRINLDPANLDPTDADHLEVNRSDVVAEIAGAFADYEEALVAGDNECLVGYFWDAPELVRFGLADRQAGASELRAWRMAASPLPGRRRSGTTITTFGSDFAVVTTLFGYGAGPDAGRQTQAWVRLPAGWRIVSAHVSWVPCPAGTGTAAGAGTGTAAGTG